MDYRNKIILAPMVRIGTLPSRLLALRFGADIVYTEEIIDFKMLKTTRVENELLNTVDFIMGDGTIVLRTCSEEKDKVVFQIGTADARRAVKVAKMVEKDVAAFDVNMGCPKPFSISGGMGAALLKQPDKIKEILTSLVENLSIPVTCKIRCLDTVEETIELAKLIQSTGVAALALHGRTRDERTTHKCRCDTIRQVAEQLTIPLIANGGSGEIKCYSDIDKFIKACGCSSVMIARAAESNMSIFSPDGLLDKEELIRHYIKVAIEVDNHWTNTKYNIQQILGSDVQYEKGERLLASQCGEDIYVIYGMLDYYKEVSAKHTEYHRKKLEELEQDLDTINGLKVKVIRDEAGEVLGYESHHRYEKQTYSRNMTPKMYLIQYMRQNRIKEPKFEYALRPVYKHFKATLILDNVKYISNQWHKKKMWAEHAACEIFMQLKNIHNSEKRNRDEELQNVNSDENSNTMKLKIGSTDIEVQIVRDAEGDPMRYTTDHRLSCEGLFTDSCTAMDLLYKHLLKRNEAEPEYDLVTDKEGRLKCTLRHDNVEYRCDHWYDSKREACNVGCLLYMLINKVFLKHINKATAGNIPKSEAKKLKLS